MSDAQDLILFSCINGDGGLSALKQLVAGSDDAARPPVLAPRHQVLEVELLGILARLSPAPDVSVSARSIGNTI
jgi:hypothetical protein